MRNITRFGLATALVIGSFSVALAQSYEPESLAPQQLRQYRNATAAPRAQHRNVAPNQPYNSYESDAPDQPWSTSMDPGNTSGGN